MTEKIAVIEEQSDCSSASGSDEDEQKGKNIVQDIRSMNRN